MMKNLGFIEYKQFVFRYIYLSLINLLLPYNQNQYHDRVKI
jgi:hypothetical protein